MSSSRRILLVLATCMAMLLSGAGPARAGLEDLGPEADSAEETVYSPTFADVPDDHVFASPIRALLVSGVTTGCDPASTRFCPDDQVTRGQMAAFLVRALGLPAGDTPGFSDDDGHTFEADIERLAAAG
ncbi:MAG: S-layer homology domain-containing protein, partial [Acidimicrobiia bacterium]